MATITKYGDDFYVIERLSCLGHRDRDGRRLVGTESLTFAFRRPDDPPHINVDPADVLSVLAQHLDGTPAGEHVYAAVAALTDAAAAATGDESGVTTSRPAPRRGRPAKQKAIPAVA